MKWLYLIPLLLVTLLIATLWVDIVLGVMLAFGFFWLTIPALILSIYIFIKSIRCSNIFQRIIVGWGIFNVLFLVLLHLYRLPQQQCSADTMAEHYEKHAKDLDDLIQYVNNAMEDSTSFYLFKDLGKISRVNVYTTADTLSYDEFIHSKERIDTLLNAVGISDSEFQNICERLDNLDCNGISMNKPYQNDSVVVIYRTPGFSTNAYILYYRPLTQEEKNRYMYDDRFIPYNEKVIFRHTAPVGAETFSKSEKEEFLRKHKPW